MNIKRDIRFRVYITFTFMCLFGCAIVARALLIQVKEGPYLRSMAKNMHTRFDTLIAERGSIVNEDGRPLSTSMPVFEVHIDFSVIDSQLFATQVDSLSNCMAALFVNKHRTGSSYKKEFIRAYDNRSKYYLLERNLKFYEYEALSNFPIFSLGKGRGGFIAESKDRRDLPFDQFARRTLGIYRDNNMSGLEAKYNDELAGENGRRVVQKSTGGLWVPIEGSEVDPVNGRDIVTTLDMELQAIAHDALLNNLRKFECAYGTCIVMEVATGKIRTMVNLGRQDNGDYLEDYNYATIPSEPGSTFKIVTLTALLSDKYINVENELDIEGGVKKFGRRTMKDSHPDAKIRNIPIWKAYAISSNVGMAKLADKYYHDNPAKFVAHLRRLHLDQRTGIDILGERRPVVRGPESKMWSQPSLPWMAIGYGVMITPLHTCMLYNAVANNGKMMKPYLVSAVKEYGKDVKVTEPEVIATLCDPAGVAQLQKCTRAVVVEGTGKDIASPFYSMSGKTGTAQVADKGIKYSAGVYQGSYVGYMPSENPKYTICVVIRTKAHSTSYYGGTIAAPVFRQVADKIFSRNMGEWSRPLDSLAKVAKGTLPAKAATVGSYNTLLRAIGKKMNVPGDYRSSIVQMVTDTATQHSSVELQPQISGVMPDVTGMKLKDAVYMLEGFGVIVKVVGAGSVHEQSVPAGATIIKGQKVTIQLG